ncbi:MAG: hypothetical protein L3J16_03660 [Anaerolineales bacterium]|nr:hypothetical protein [Anaerolineales bacterium]
MKRTFLKALYFIYIRIIAIIKPITLGVRVMLIRDGGAACAPHLSGSLVSRWRRS